MKNIKKYTMIVNGNKLNIEKFINILNEKYNCYENINLNDFKKETSINDDKFRISYRIENFFKNDFKNNFIYLYEDDNNLLNLTKILNLRLAIIVDNYNYAEHYILDEGVIIVENKYTLFTENEGNMKGIESIRLNRIEALEKEVMDKCYTPLDLLENIKFFLFDRGYFYLLLEVINQINEKEGILQDYNYYSNNIHFFIDKFDGKYNVLNIIESLIKAYDYKYCTTDEYVKIDKLKSLNDSNLKGIESFNCYEVAEHLEKNIYEILTKIVTRPYYIEVKNIDFAYMLTALKVMYITESNK